MTLPLAGPACGHGPTRPCFVCGGTVELHLLKDCVGPRLPILLRCWADRCPEHVPKDADHVGLCGDHLRALRERSGEAA